METNNEIRKNDSFIMKNISSLKVAVIGIVALLLLIPLAMVDDLAGDRERAADKAAQEVGNMWSNPQIIAGPMLVSEVEGKLYTILPETLNVDGTINTETRKRGIFDVVVYHSNLKIDGTFVFSDEMMSVVEKMRGDDFQFFIGISDLRGIEENVSVSVGDGSYYLSSGSGNISDNSGIRTLVKIRKESIQAGTPIPFSTAIKLKGSKSVNFAPLGNVTSVKLQSDYATPSFCGNFLPTERSVTEDGFSAVWKVLGMNRNYPQLVEQKVSSKTEFLSEEIIDEAVFGVDLKVPVTQYQQTSRAVKYGILIILLVFVSAFIVEISTKKPIHILQYFIVGLALVLFYSLLLSISEYLSFGIAYLIASAMTIILLSAYFKGILHHKSAYVLTALLVIIYAFIYILLQMEVYALLVGSLGLFVIMGCIMYFTRTLSK